jgi:hypothetical protein
MNHLSVFEVGKGNVKNDIRRIQVLVNDSCKLRKFKIVVVLPTLINTNFIEQAFAK